MNIVGKRNIVIFVVIFLVACLMSIPLFSGTRIVDQCDMFGALLKLAGMHLSWMQGHWAGRWVADINYGYGYPVFNYYPPLFYYLGTGLAFLTGNIIIAFNMTIFLCLFCSGLAMYFFAKEFWGKAGALLSAVLYLLAPFHIVQIYVLGACAQLLAFVFFPLILLSLYRLHHTGSWGWAVSLSACVAGLSLAHNGQTMLFLPIAFAYLIFLEITVSCVKQAISFGRKVLAMLLGLGISAYFWVPAILEKGYVYIEKSTSAYTDFHAHFLALSQLFFSPWGYNISQPAGGFSFQVGWPHWICFFLFLILLPFLWKKHREGVLTAVFLSVIVFVAVFMVLRPSIFIWEHVPPLKFLQFPWRFLTIITFIICFVSGSVLLIKDRRWRLAAGAGLLLFTFVWNIRYCHPVKFAEPDVQDLARFLYQNNPRDGMEFLPIGVKRIYMPQVKEKLGFFAGRMAIQHEEIKGLDYHYAVSAQEPTLAVFYSFYFPGWEVSVDGQKARIITDNDFGLIVFSVPPGEHKVSVRFTSTPLRDMAGAVSYVSLFLWLVLAGWWFFPRVFLRKWTCLK